jgi:type IV secretory pathway VirB10-like protein
MTGLSKQLHGRPDKGIKEVKSRGQCPGHNEPAVFCRVLRKREAYMFRFLTGKFVALAFILAAFVYSPQGAQAASECKGLSKSVCESRDDCSAVKAHTRSDGTKVKAFCRKKPGQGSSSSSSKKPKKKMTAAEKKKAAAKKKRDAAKKKKQEEKMTPAEKKKAAAKKKRDAAKKKKAAAEKKKKEENMTPAEKKKAKAKAKKEAAAKKKAEAKKKKEEAKKKKSKKKKSKKKKTSS